jgi:hypothetical protein
VFIKNEYPKFEEFSEIGRKRLVNLEHGSLILRFDPAKENVLGRFCFH